MRAQHLTLRSLSMLMELFTILAAAPASMLMFNDPVLLLVSSITEFYKTYADRVLDPNFTDNCNLHIRLRKRAVLLEKSKRVGDARYMARYNNNL